MRNILFLLTRYPGIGGIETITTLLANELVSQYGILICSHIQENEERLLRELEPRVQFFRLPQVSNDEKNILFLKGLIAEKNVDVVVYQDSYFYNEALPETLARDSRVKLVVVEHNSPNHLNMSIRLHFQENAWYKNVCRTCKTLVTYFLVLHRNRKRRSRLYRAADRYVLLSESLIRSFHQFSYTSDSTKLAVIGNPVSYRCDEMQVEVKQKQVLFVAQLIRRKGIQNLLNIWSQVEPEFPDWKLTIVGDGELMESAREFISSRGLQRVELPGFVHPVTPYYRTAQIFCLCSSFEGYPMVLPEAMCSGVIPIAFDSFPALHDIIDDNENGYIIPAFDEGAFAQKLKNLMSDEQLRARMRASALRKSCAFEIAPVVEKWVELFESL